MSEFTKFLAVQHARHLFQQGVDLAVGARISAQLFDIEYIEVVHLAGRAIEECGTARRALGLASPPNDTPITDDAKVGTPDAPAGGDEAEVEREIADWIEQRGNSKKKR